MLAPHLPAPRRRPALSLAFALALATCFTTHLRTPACVYAAEPPEPPSLPPADAVILAPIWAGAPDRTGKVWLTLAPIRQHARVEEHVPPAPDEDDDGSDGWQTICREPCGVWVSPRSKLRVNGDFAASAPFHVPAFGTTTAVVHTKAAPPRALALPITLITVSGIALFTSSLVFVLQTLPGTSHDSTLRRNAAIAAGFSLGGLITGIWWVRHRNHTEVSVDTATTGSPSRASTSAASPVGNTSDGIRPLSIAIGHGLSVSPDGVHF